MSTSNAGTPDVTSPDPAAARSTHDRAVPEVGELGRVHLVGVGGVGMSAVALLLAARGVPVSGSDARDSAVVAALRDAGVRVHVGHDAAHVDDVDTLVVSSAIRETNPELAAARARGLRVLHRSVALAALMAGRRTVAVAGAHGKTTTSAMVAGILTAAGRDPSYAIGAAVDGPVGARHGEGDVVVAEADESDGSFLAYRPEVAVVTNVEPDHLDHYGTREAFEDAFAAFATRIVPGGSLVVCLDDDGGRRLASRAAAHDVSVVGYGTGPDAVVRLGRWRPAGEGGSLAVTDVRDGTEAVLELVVPGAHNGLDAAAAWTAARALGVPSDVAVAALGEFRGTGRRFEDRGSRAGVRVVDDYAHHPTEVAALLRAARTVAGDGRVLVLFQPHLFSRTRTFAREFAEALATADLAVVTDVYAAREDPEPGVTGALITDAMPAGRGVFVADCREAAAVVGAQARPGDLVLTVGAGDVTALAPLVLDAVRGELGAGR